ncbi:Snu71p SCDLUD_003356 [Saccharomycodes ludwigii]|uniref:Snu71p n=1 Tax=Saccharomycodes ludwigii TaxID=36035 RepID=UPI001E8C2B4E|nr:hypothetical protein SCDLUD_003356 [Saccharomycodes ludwigii]KAH3900380.1 hypothetical protein SCDLUD_003356 [Saccharomycodes ludwigii]
MQTFLYVSPTLYTLREKNWKSKTPKLGYIPILSNDINKFKQILDNKLLNSNKKNGHHNNIPNKIKNGNNNSNNDLTSTESQKNTLSQTANKEKQQNEKFAAEDPRKFKYLDLKSFQPASLEQQIHTLCISNLPNIFSKQAKNNGFLMTYQRFLTKLIGRNDTVLSCWTYIEVVDKIILYFRISDKISNEDYKKTFYLIKTKISKLDGCHFHYDENVQRFLDSIDINKEEQKLSIDNKIIEDLKSVFKRKQLVKDANLNKVTNDSNITYHVDLNKLSDLPQSLLEPLCKDIVRFRTRVYTIEKEKIMKQTLLEDKEQKQHLQEVFEKIKKNSTKFHGIESGNEDQDEEDKYDDEYTIFEDMDEKDYILEKNRLDSIKGMQDKQFEDLLNNKFYKDVYYRYQDYSRSIDKLEHYDSYLAKERSLNLKALLYSTQDLYYDHNRSYRENEILMDDKDRALYPNANRTEHDFMSNSELEATHINGPTISNKEPEINNASTSKSIPKIKLNMKSDKTTEGSGPNATNVVPNGLLPFTEEELKLKIQIFKNEKFIDEIINEYLGCYEEELVEFVLDHILEYRNLKFLEKELYETFDDDATNIVLRIWKKLREV